MPALEKAQRSPQASETRAERLRELLGPAVASSLGGEFCERVTYECDFDADAWPAGLQPSHLCDAVKRILLHLHQSGEGVERITIRIEQVAKRKDAVSPYACGYLMIYAEDSGMTILMAY